MEKEVSITLPVAAWNVVMAALMKRPFEEVADLLNVIKKQADAQLASAQQPAADED